MAEQHDDGAQEVLDRDIKASALEATRFLTKAFRGTIPLEDQTNRLLLKAAPGTVANYTRLEQTRSAREQTRSALALAIADSDGASRAEYLRLAMPSNPIVRALPAPQKAVGSGD